MYSNLFEWGAVGKDIKMTHNSRLVNYFISEFYSSKTIALEHIASPTFKFIVDDGDALDFYQYASRKDLMSGYCQLDFEPPQTSDDLNFSSTLKLAVPRKDKSILHGSGVITFEVSEDLLQVVNVKYDQTGEDNKTLQSAILECRNADQEITLDSNEDQDELMFL